MAAIVTDQFRILNASNFIDSVVDSSNSYYVFLGLDNPAQVPKGLFRFRPGRRESFHGCLFPSAALAEKRPEYR